jgi:hypothetical protein
MTNTFVFSRNKAEPFSLGTWCCGAHDDWFGGFAAGVYLASDDGEGL